MHTNIRAGLGLLSVPVQGRFRAARLAATYASAISASFADNSLVIRDPVTPTNNYNGPLISNGAFNKFTYSRASLATYIGSNGLVQWAPTNLHTQSQFASGWATSAATLTPNAAIAPDGTTTMANLVPTTANAQHSVYQAVSVPGASLPTRSFYAKANGYTRVGSTDANYGTWAAFDLTGAGSVIAASATCTASIVLVGNGVYRCIIAAFTPNPSGGFRHDITPLDNSYTTGIPNTYAFAGDGTSGVYVWGAQLEPSSVVSSYKPTTSSAFYGPRIEYDPVTRAVRGYLAERASTNYMLWSRDLTNAAWTKTNITAALNQVGADGGANSASLLTATAGNGTCLQVITLTSRVLFQSAYIKRVTGTGTINMTMDNGATWTAVTPTAAWSKVRIPIQTLANPTIGFQIVTSGDAIAVDYCQSENQFYDTSPIPTTTAAATRASDALSLPNTKFNIQLASSVYVKNSFQGGSTLDGASRMSISITDGTGPNTATIYNGGSTNAFYSQNYGIIYGTATAADVFTKVAFAVAVNDAASAQDGALKGTLSPVAAAPAATTLQVGGWQNGASGYLNGTIQEFMYVGQRITNAALQALTS